MNEHDHATDSKPVNDKNEGQTELRWYKNGWGTFLVGAYRWQHQPQRDNTNRSKL